MDRRDKAITLARDPFNKLRAFRRVPQRLAQFPYHVVEAVLVIHKRLARPKRGAKFL